MEQLVHLTRFIEMASRDGRMSPAHMSLYLALYYCWQQNGFDNPVSVFRHKAMELAKIAGRTTYQKCINDLQDFGYIGYMPSYNHFLGSLVYVNPLGMLYSPSSGSQHLANSSYLAQ